MFRGFSTMVSYVVQFYSLIYENPALALIGHPVFRRAPCTEGTLYPVLRGHPVLRAPCAGHPVLRATCAYRAPCTYKAPCAIL